MTLRPPQPVTEQVATLAISGDLLTLTFRERNEAFRQIAWDLRFRWNEVAMRRERKITAQTGTAEDRLIEAAYKLLGAGFIVDVPDGIDAERVGRGEYVDEHTRWVMARTTGKYTGWFSISWAYGEEYYQRARKLPGSRYSKPNVVVPSEYFEEVGDFAALYDFRLSSGAQKLLEQAKAKRLQAVRVELQPRAAKEVVGVATVNQSVVGGIADEFLDED